MNGVGINRLAPYGRLTDFPVEPLRCSGVVVLTVCWSVKGGVGTSVVAAALALRTAASGVDSLLVDLDGDQPAILGLVPPAGPGVGGWLAAGHDVPVDVLGELEMAVCDRLTLLPLGDRAGLASADRLDVLGAVLAGSSRSVIVDAGSTAAQSRWWIHHGRSLLVLRPCYLGLSRVGRVAPGCSVVVIDEPGRALTVADVSAATGAELRCRLPWDPAVARAVDAGILASRMPRSLRSLGVAA